MFSIVAIYSSQEIPRVSTKAKERTIMYVSRAESSSNSVQHLLIQPGSPVLRGGTVIFLQHHCVLTGVKYQTQ